MKRRLLARAPLFTGLAASELDAVAQTRVLRAREELFLLCLAADWGPKGHGGPDMRSLHLYFRPQ